MRMGTKEKRGLPNVRQREASSLLSTTWGGTRTDGAEWKRAMCDTDLPSPPRLSQRTWLHYFMSLTGNQRWCLIPTKTAWWIINARSKKTKHNNSNKKMHIIMYSERPLGQARATVRPSLSRSLKLYLCAEHVCFKQGKILRMTNGNDETEILKWKNHFSPISFVFLWLRVRSWDCVFYCWHPCRHKRYLAWTRHVLTSLCLDKPMCMCAFSFWSLHETSMTYPAE